VSLENSRLSQSLVGVANETSNPYSMFFAPLTEKCDGHTLFKGGFVY